VTIEVDEGPVYQLGNVQIAGDGLDVGDLMKQAAFQTGKMANWRLVEASIERIQTALKTQGFLGASIKQNRVLLAANIADLTLSISKGRQYFFGQLTLLGLDEELEKAARLKWKLAPGAPMNETYVTEYLKSLYSDKRLPAGKKISRDMKVDLTQPGVVNVTIQLK
jgi:outer membrane protein assembly factor BamA